MRVLAPLLLLAALVVPQAVAAPGAVAASVPRSVDLRRYAVAAGDQGSTDSCVGWVAAELVGWYGRRLHRSGGPFAPMYVYAQINGGVDEGAEPLEALRLLVRQGIDTAAHYVQGPQDWYDRPTAAERANAARWRVSGYRTVFAGARAGTRGAEALKRALAAGRPVALDLTERPGFDALHGTAVDRDTTGTNEGTHEVLALGYDAAGLLVENSFGASWGSHGFGRLGWDVVERDALSGYTIDGFAPRAASASAHSVPSPVVSAPRAVPRLGGTVSAAGSVPFVVSFGARSSSGIAATRLLRQVDGGAWSAVRLRSATATSVVVALAPGHRYRFAASARDRAGHGSAAIKGAALSVGSRSESSGAVAYTGRWRTYAARWALGGRTRVTTQGGASATLTFTGTGVAWVATLAPDRAEARVYVHGRYRGTVDLHASSTRARTVALEVAGLGRGAHRLRLVVVHRSGRSTGRRRRLRRHVLTFPGRRRGLLRSADVGLVGLEDQVRPALAVPLQEGDRGRGLLTQRGDERGVGCVRAGGQQVARLDALAQHRVVGDEAVDLVDEPGRGGAHLRVQAVRRLGARDVLGDVLAEVAQPVHHRREPRAFAAG